MDDTPIRVCATADTLTLYWDKPARAPADCRYEVCAGGRIPVTVAHTHCTLTGLAPATEYTLEVWLEGRSLGTCRASTEPRLPRLDARDITVRDCRAPRVLIHAVPYNNDGTPAPQPPKFSDFTFTGVTLTGARWCRGPDRRSARSRSKDLRNRAARYAGCIFTAVRLLKMAANCGCGAAAK